MAFLLCFNFCAQAEECPSCHATGISALAMECPDCGANLHDPRIKFKGRQESELIVKLLYTGNDTANLPPYGKLYINGKYYGNIPLIECQDKADNFSQAWANGLGKDFSAYYEKRVKKLPVGTLRVEVKMKFKRLYGFGRSYKKVCFPYVGFEANKKTVIKHYFNSAVSFHKYKPTKRKPIPVVSEAKIQAASGSVALNVPLFK